MKETQTKKRFAIVGTGVRGLCFAKAIKRDYQDRAELVALFDRNMSRMAGFDKLIESETPRFTDFDEMVALLKQALEDNGIEPADVAEVSSQIYRRKHIIVDMSSKADK